MARIRTIKPDFFVHEELFNAEQEENLPLRIAFAGLWTICDREGRFKWRPNTIKLSVLPFDSVDFSRVLDALASRGFIEQYATESGDLFGFVPSFTDHQVINNRESESLIPSPFDASITRDPRALILHKGKGREGKGREEEGKECCANDARNKKGTRLPDDWVLPKAWGEWALTEKPTLTADDVRRIAADYKDYWIAKSGKDATKMDWLATWRKWVRSPLNDLKKTPQQLSSPQLEKKKCEYEGCQRTANSLTSRGHRCVDHLSK